MLLQALGTVHIPDATPESELVQVLAILGALAAENDKSTLLAVLQGLSPQVLADCVIANMAHLPAANSVAGAGGSAGGLAGLMQVRCYCIIIMTSLRRVQGLGAVQGPLQGSCRSAVTTLLPVLQYDCYCCNCYCLLLSLLLCYSLITSFNVGYVKPWEGATKPCLH